MTADDPDLVPAIHPGEFVWEDVLTPLQLDVRTAAEKMGLDVHYLQALVDQRESVTEEAAQALGALAGNGPSLWMALQSLYDKWQSRLESQGATRKMKVNFDDTVDNWYLWGQLVELWISGIHPLPKDVKDLVSQAYSHGITNVSIPGSQDRRVNFHWYDDAKELAFMLPTENMLRAARTNVEQQLYQLPAFYDRAYGGSRRSRRQFGHGAGLEFAFCRLGEFAIYNGI